jgi:hypothetical protein
MAKIKIGQYQVRDLSKADPDKPIELKVKLGDLFKADLSNRPILKEAIAQEIIDTILRRTQQQRKNRHGGSLDGYSPEYEKSEDFKAFGKRPGSIANLTLTGDMLGLMDLVKNEGSDVVIGWPDLAADVRKRAHGHITGNIYKKVKKNRDFLGLTEDELEGIKKRFKDQIPRESDTPTTRTAAQALDLLRRILLGEGDNG